MNRKRAAQGKKRRDRSRSRSASSGPVPLYKRSISHFKPSERDRGAEILQEGTNKLEVEGPRARAKVRGGEGEDAETCRVGIDWTRVAERRILTFCECEDFAEGRFCGHIWAVLLALAETGPENQPPGRDRLGLRKDRATNWEDLGPDLGSQIQGRSSDSARNRKKARAPRQRAATAVGRRGRTVTTSWRSRIAALKDELDSPFNQTLAPAAPAVRTPVAIEFAINTTASLGNSGLVLDVFGRTTDSSGKPG